MKKKWKFGGGVDQSTQTALRRKRTGARTHLKRIGVGDIDGIVRQLEKEWRVPEYKPLRNKR